MKNKFAATNAGKTGVAILIVVIVLAIIAYFVWGKGAANAPVSSESSSLGGTVANTITGSSDVAAKIAPETNPFKTAEVNPFTSVYQNPFGSK
ncbi:MAG: hypothetical protein WC250_00165 [Candidatus Paceibacterota bacterium]|jgi:hypothetical protein